MLNAPSPLPKSPGRWVNLERCSGCGATFKEHRAHPAMGAASQRIRQRNDDKQFRSRGPLLWEMHVMKAEDWYVTHAGCGTHEGAQRHSSFARRQSTKQVEAEEQDDGLYTIKVAGRAVMADVPEAWIESVNDMIHNGRDYASILAAIDAWNDDAY